MTLLADSVWVWSFDPFQTLPWLVLLGLYAGRIHRLAQRGTRIPWWRQLSFCAGVGVALFALISPIDELGEERSQVLHMTQHLLLGDIAPLLVVIGVTGPVLRPLLALPRVGHLRVLAHPLPALVIWIVTFYGWHLPAAYEGALNHDSVHALEHGMFFLAGFLIWATLLEPLPGPPGFTALAKVFYLLLVHLFEGLLANIFVWSSTTFYPTYDSAKPLWGMTAIESQNLAGVVLLIEGTVITLIMLGVLFTRALSADDARQRLIEIGVDEVRASRAARYGNAEALLSDVRRRRSAPCPVTEPMGSCDPVSTDALPPASSHHGARGGRDGAPSRHR